MKTCPKDGIEKEFSSFGAFLKRCASRIFLSQYHQAGLLEQLWQQAVHRARFALELLRLRQQHDAHLFATGLQVTRSDQSVPAIRSLSRTKP